MRTSKLHLQYLGTYQYQNKLWFSNGGFNGLFSIDLNDFSLKFEQMIPYLDKMIQWAYYGNIQCVFGDKLFLFPFNCSYIMVYDFQSDEIQKICVTPMNDSKIYMTAGIFQKKDKVWVFPGDMSAGMFILDLKRMHLEEDIELSKILQDVEHIYNYENVIQLNEEEAAILSGTNAIIRVNVLKKQVVCSKCFEEDIHIWSIKHDGRNFWLLPYESTCVYEWNPDIDRLVKYELQDQDAEWIDIPGSPYINMVFFENEIILLPSRLKFLMKIDKEMNTIRKAIDYPKGFTFLRNQFGVKQYPAFGAFDIINNKLILHPLLGNMLLIYHIEENRIEGIEFIVTHDEVPYLDEIILGQVYQESGVLYEKDGFGGIVELMLMVHNNSYEYKKDGKKSDIGEKIYHTLCQVN